ncbi:MAG: hypothetical protein AM326_00065 [Candidatus Thorarchaeota archaeon SMTZ-45]|nr:MAG: hypothetical protein AM326_00065 [Candidatus Thorarchaeota archaeon SMTZ-45]
MQRGNILFISLLLASISGSLVFIISFIINISFLGIVGLIIVAISFTFLMVIPQKFRRENIFAESFFSTIFGLSKIISHFDAKGNGFIIPPTALTDKFLLYIPYMQERLSEIPLGIRKPNRYMLVNRGLLFLPIGFSLVELFEKKLNINFSSIGLFDLAELMHQILVDKFNMVTNIYIEVFSNKILVQLVDSMFFDLSYRLSIEMPKILTQIGNPLSSAIGCILSKISERIVYVASYKLNTSKKLTEIVYILSKTI